VGVTRSPAVAAVEAAAMLVAASPGDAEAVKALEEAVAEALLAGLPEQEIERIAHEATEVFGQLLKLLLQQGSVYVEGLGLILATGKKPTSRFEN